MIGIKVVILIALSCFIIFGYTYCLDMLQALEVPLRQPPYSFSTWQFNLLYLFTYAPIFLLNIPIGIILDRSPITTSLLILLTLSLLSQLICTFMINTQISGYITVMYVMRGVLGLAGEGAFTVQAMIISKYCQTDYQLVMSLALSLPFLMDSVNSFTTTLIYQTTANMIYPWSVGVAFCIFSLLSGILLIKIYVKSSKMHDENNHSKRQTEKNNQDKEINQNNLNFNESITDVFLPKQNSMEKKEQNNMQREEQNTMQREEQNNMQREEVISGGQKGEQSCIRELKSFSWNFWILIGAVFFTENCLASFNDNLNDLLVKRFDLPYTHAGTLLIIPYGCLTIFSFIFSPVFASRPQWRRPSFMLSTALYTIGMIVLYTLPETNNPTIYYYLAIAFFLLTMSFNFAIFYGALLTAIPNIIPKNTIGTAFGVIGCVIGLSQTASPFLNIAIIDSSSDLSVSYKNLTLLYILLAFIPFCFALFIYFADFEQFDELLAKEQGESVEVIQVNEKVEGKTQETKVK